MSESPPRQEPLAGDFGFALTVDVEEWYHTCLVPEYVDPSRRPALENELGWLLPDLLDLLAQYERRATFFVLGEVAERHPELVRRIVESGHELASHGHTHFRVGDRSPEDFQTDLRYAKALLEDLGGVEVLGYRAPEWSLRRVSHPGLRQVAAAGHVYDASLTTVPGMGWRGNPAAASRLVFEGGTGEGLQLLEIPPLVCGRFLPLPAASWLGRLAPMGRWLRAARAHRSRGGLPVAVIHPWEISGKPTPGRLSGAARFIHEAGRLGFRRSFETLLAALPWTSVQEASGGWLQVPRAVRPTAVGE